MPSDLRLTILHRHSTRKNRLATVVACYYGVPAAIHREETGRRRFQDLDDAMLIRKDKTNRRSNANGHLGPSGRCHRAKRVGANAGKR